MDSRKYVILIKNKNRTKDVKNCSFKNSVYSITFHNSKQLYLYNTYQVKYYQIDEKNSISPDSIVVTYDKAYKDGKILSLTEVNTGEKSQMFIGETKEYMDHFNCLKPMSVISDLSDKIIRCNGTIFASIKMIYVYIFVGVLIVCGITFCILYGNAILKPVIKIQKKVRVNELNL